MKKCLKAVAMLILGMLFLTGCRTANDTGIYEVFLPVGYEESGMKYPVVYVMPQNGYYLDDSGISEILVKEMEEGNMLDAIIVKPEFEKDADVIEEMKKITTSVDSQYRTIADKKGRVLVGTGTGGYLAYTIGLSEKESFGVMASVRGDFASESNPWIATYGNVSDTLKKLKDFGSSYFDEVYTYMDAPVDDEWTNMEGSTNDLGIMFIEMGTGSSAHEFTVREGEFDNDFLKESVKRLVDRMTEYMFSDCISGIAGLEKATLSEKEESAKVQYSVEVSDTISRWTSTAVDTVIKATVIDPKTGEVLAIEKGEIQLAADGKREGEIVVDNIVKGASSDIELSIEVFGGEVQVASTTLKRKQSNENAGEVDLSSDWYFYYAGTKETLEIASITPEVYKKWSVVQPGYGNWGKGYGNIDKNTVSGPEEYFDYMIVGNGYYVKEFELPEKFDDSEVTLSIGYVDDRCEVFLNGKRVGATGMTKDGKPDGETTWAKLSEFTVKGKLLNKDGKNTIIVRAWNDEPYGAGGWYDGPIFLRGAQAEEEPEEEPVKEEKECFYEETFKTSATKNGKYLIYLPEDYYETERYYPTMYLLHQFNSDHTSYQIDNIDEVLKEGVESGLFDDMIVVIPNSEEESWWTGRWRTMITDDLIPHIDAKYRTIRDARYRMTAGCSMGGQGAFSVAVTNPDYFTGAASFYGAFSMAPSRREDALYIAKQEPKEYLDYFSYSFICGNQDSYGFGVPAIELHQIFEEKEVEHKFFIENGGHDSGFYLPYFNECVGYVRSNMYQADKSVEKLVSASTKVDGAKLKVTFEAAEGIKDYFNHVPESSYTKEKEEKLSIPLIIQIVKNGDVLDTTTVKKNAVSAKQMSTEYEFDFTKDFENLEDFEIVVKAAVFDKIVELK